MNSSELEKIADILPPMAPAASTDSIWPVIFLIIFLLCTVGIYFYRSNKQQLRRLHKKHLHKKINQRQLAFELAQLVTQKDHSPSNGSWNIFHNQLQAACFSRNGLHEDAMKELMTSAEQWI